MLYFHARRLPRFAIIPAIFAIYSPVTVPPVILEARYLQSVFAMF